MGQAGPRRRPQPPIAYSQPRESCLDLRPAKAGHELLIGWFVRSLRHHGARTPCSLVILKKLTRRNIHSISVEIQNM